jgi:hypothetical protein
MRKRKGVIREGVALALSLALVGSGMNLSGISVMAADMGQDDAFNPAVTSEGVAGWNNSDDDKETITEFGKDPITSTGNNTIASDNDSDKAPWNQIDESEDENVIEDVTDAEQTDSETTETSEDANAGIALLSVVEDVLEADSLEQRICAELVTQIKANSGSKYMFTVTPESIKASPEEVKNYIKSILPHNILNAVLRDCPYDMYWVDVAPGTGFNVDENGNLVVQFFISKQYQNSTFVFDSEAVKNAEAAKDNVTKIVQENEKKNVKDMLKAYQEKICNLTSYNTAENEKYKNDPKDSTLDNNAWNPVYVFDDDDTNQVVCEGYSKAFQYLCDKSDLPSNTKCYTVSGQMAGGTGSGAHMWNIVRIDGKSYLVDVTNSDAGTAGDPTYNSGTTPLFLAVPTSGSVEEGYTFKLPNGQTITYKYDKPTLDLYGKDSPILKLANTPSESKPDGTPKPTPNPNPNPVPDWDFEGKPDWDQDSSNSDVNPDWIDQDSTTNPDLDMDPNWTDDNPILGGSVSSDKNNSGSSDTNNTNNNGVINGNVNMDVNNGNSTGNTNTSTNAAGSNAQPSTASPKTGDHNTIMIYMMLMLLALGTIGSVCVIRQKRN